MKVVYVTSESYIDHSYTIVRELRKHIDDFPVFLQGREKTKEIETWCNKLNAVFVKRKRFRNPVSIFSELGFILRIRKLKPDIVWFNTLTVYQLFLVKLLIKKFLVVVHDIEIHPGGGAVHGTLSVKMAFKFAKRNICVVSKTQAGLFKRSYGIEPKVFQLPIINYYREIANEDIKKEEGSKICFFFFGSIEAYKGIEALIGAAEILEKKGIGFILNIYGKIKYSRGVFSEKMNSLRNVTLYDEFVNYREVHKIYNQNDVIILPYKQVTQCGPLLIAFDELVPAICSDLEGFREYVEDGKNGIVFNNSKEDLADKMKLFIYNPDLILNIKDNIRTETHGEFSMNYLQKSYIENFIDELNP